MATLAPPDDDVLSLPDDAFALVYRGLLGRRPVAAERDAAGGDARTLVGRVVRTDEFLFDVAEPLGRHQPLKAAGFAGHPRWSVLERLSRAILAGADVASVATWRDWLELVLEFPAVVEAAPATVRRYRELRELEEERARAWTRTRRVAGPQPPDGRPARARLIGSGLFDPDWYAARYPDTRHLDSAEHYLNHGGAEGRWPSAAFDAASYLADNPDVRHAGANPLLHWIDHGSREGRASPLLAANASELGLVLQDLCDPRRDERPVAVSDDRFKVSVLTPAFNTRPVWLRELYRSLANQIYAHWEWVVCDDASTDPATLATLHDLAALDERVIVVPRRSAGGIAAATNDALARAGGSHVALVDHDDLLSRDALLAVWRCWCEAPGCRLFYTDECKLAEDGGLYDVSLKPAWSPVLLENTMYIGHLTVYDRQLVEEAGRFRGAYDGTQDFDLALRASRLVEAGRHVDVIGYVWRAVPGSTAASMGEKQWGVRRQLASLRDHARATAAGADVLPGFSAGYWRTVYPLSEAPPLLSLVIPTGAGSRIVRGDRVDLLVNCIASMVERRFYPSLEIVVVHNGDLSASQLAFLETVERLVLVAYDEPLLNLARKINMGVAAASGTYVCLLNDDVEAITPGAGAEMVSFLQAHPAVGAIGPLCLFEDGRVQHNGVMLLEQGPAHSGIFQSPDFAGPFGYLRMRREAYAVTGALMIVAHERYLAVGGFDERLPLNYNDVHFCQKLRVAGWSCVVDPGVRVFHFESATKVGTFQCEKETFFLLSPTNTDPYFNRRYDQRNPNYHVPRVGRTAPEPVPLFETWLDRRIGVAGRMSQEVASGKPVDFSVGMSVFNQPVGFLREMLNSLEMQTYPHLEIVMVDDGSTAADTVAWLATMRDHPKVTLVRHDANRGIAGGLRTMLAAARHDFFVPVDGDDFLTVDALACMASAIGRHPSAVYFYSDEFKSDTESRKFSPFFKPQFDPVMLTNNCYVGHLMAIRVAALRAQDGYGDDRATWCHDWDSTLRLLASGAEPVHVPEPLYAWRINPGSTASAESDQKPQAIESQRFVLERYLAARGLTERLSVKRNTLGPMTGMWALEASAPVNRVVCFDAYAFWGEGDWRERLLMACAEPSLDWVAVLTNERPAEDVLRDLSAPVLLDPRVCAVGGQLLDAGGRLLWSGGFFDEGRIVEPAAGRLPVEGGYHGQLYCQRCVDIVAPANLLVSTAFLRPVLAAMPAGEGEAAELMIALALAAVESGHYVVATPWVSSQLAPDWRQLMPLDRSGRLKDHPLAQASRWRFSSDDRARAHAVFGPS